MGERHWALHIINVVCDSGGYPVREGENLRGIVGRNLRIVRGAVCEPFRVHRRTEHTSLYQRIRTDTFCLFHRLASRSRFLLLVQTGRHAPQHVGLGCCRPEHRGRLRHICHRQRPDINAPTGRYPVRCGNQHAGTRCRTTNPLSVAFRRETRRSTRNCFGICRRIPARRNRHYPLDDSYPLPVPHQQRERDQTALPTFLPTK